MRFAIVGSGYWGGVYARTLDKMGIPHGKWDRTCDGAIIATPNATHYGIAKAFLADGIPILLEKPVTLCPVQARELAGMGGIVFTGHTRLYSPAWRLYRDSLPPIKTVRCVMGRPNVDPWWDCGAHLVAMCLDAGFNPGAAQIHTPNSYVPLSFVVNGEHEFRDVVTDPSPLEVLIAEFSDAIERGEPDNRGMVLGLKVVEFLNESRRLHIH